jgi:hypothetical protein
MTNIKLLIEQKCYRHANKSRDRTSFSAIQFIGISKDHTGFNTIRVAFSHRPNSLIMSIWIIFLWQKTKFIMTRMTTVARDSQVCNSYVLHTDDTENLSII